ncbi:uncharacterized protein LOC120085971 isoform X2 [Benincasa hispida]|uniref:uncharacterized protein LOC120085971 isoform X2 n=1 Tax=Benincasa hispida TaxID=102211 RepID=UPI00190002CE|nr:uncharacterized protein LOC120085971 isoform X2 [Benincasa hispida]
MIISTVVSVTNHNQCDKQTSSAFMNRDRQIIPNLGSGYSNGSSRLEIDGHHPIYEVIPTEVTTRKTDAQNGSTIKFQRDQSRPLAAANPPSNGAIEEQASYYTSLDNGTTGYKRVELRTENGIEVADLYLERIYEKPSSHNFYCPNCQACITKVIIRDREWVDNTVSAPVPTQVDKFRCTSCLSFLTPIGTWLFPRLASPDPEEEVPSGPGNDVENLGIREESQVDRAPVPAQSVDYAVTDKNEDDHAAAQAHPSLKATSEEGIIVREETLASNKGKGNNVENIEFRERDILQVQETRDSQKSQVERAPVPDQSVNYAVADKNEVVPDPSVGNAVADQTRDIHAVSNSKPTHPSLNMKVAEEGAVQDKGVKSIQGNKIESIIVGRPDPLLESAETIYDQEIQADSINKTLVPDQLDEFDMWTNDNSLENKVDSTEYSSILDGAKEDTKKGITVENIVVGIPYTSHELNGSMQDVDNQTSTVNKVDVQNQSNGFSVLSESETDAKVNLTRGHTSLEAMMAETVTDTSDEKRGINVENVVVGIPYPSLESKGRLLDRFCLPALLNKAPVPDQSAAVAETDIRKTPETVEATVPDSSPVSSSLAAPTAAERVTDSAVGSREVEAGPVTISIGESLDEQVQPEPSRYNRWEIVKSIVYGGLAESITSLGIVASAASANTETGNIVVLALANLISGFFILGHNLTGLKSEQFRTSNETDYERIDRYEVVLGNRENYILHFTLAIFSFVLFGLVPPLVYGFSFTKSNDKDLKLAAVAGASLLCVILLAFGKAYIQRPNRWDVYVKIVASYIVIAAGAGGFSYLAGDLIDKLIKKYGWFEENPAFNLSLPLPEMSLAKPAWGSS